jgi:hypothetical protein
MLSIQGFVWPVDALKPDKGYSLFPEAEEVPLGVHRQTLASLSLHSPDLKLARKGVLSCSVGACGRCPVPWGLSNLATHCSRVTSAIFKCSVQYAASSMQVEAPCAENGTAGCHARSS